MYKFCEYLCVYTHKYFSDLLCMCDILNVFTVLFYVLLCIVLFYLLLHVPLGAFVAFFTLYTKQFLKDLLLKHISGYEI